MVFLLGNAFIPVFQLLNMKKKLLGTVFDAKTVAVIYALLGKKGRFYLRDLSRESGVSLATAHRIILAPHQVEAEEKELKYEDLAEEEAVDDETEQEQKIH